MARPLRIEYKGALYHVAARGNELKMERRTTVNKQVTQIRQVFEYLRTSRFSPLKECRRPAGVPLGEIWMNYIKRGKQKTAAIRQAGALLTERIVALSQYRKVGVNITPAGGLTRACLLGGLSRVR